MLILEYDLVASIFGEEFGSTNAIARVVYVLVGVSAVATLGGLALTQLKPTAIGSTKARPVTSDR
jgi:uncharacterized membrane protein YuzA (DUF378 family)